MRKTMMHHRPTCLVAAVVALLALAEPALGIGSGAAVHFATRSTLAAAATVPPRVTIERQLLALGYAPDAASDAAAHLTADDLAVLLDNPLMMQRAGELDNLTRSYIIGGLIVAGVVALAIAGSGSVTIN